MLYHSHITNPCTRYSWWRHQMETIFAFLVICEGNPPVTGGFPSQRPVTRGFDVFFDLRLNKRSRRQWFVMLVYKYRKSVLWTVTKNATLLLFHQQMKKTCPENNHIYSNYHLQTHSDAYQPPDIYHFNVELHNVMDSPGEVIYRSLEDSGMPWYLWKSHFARK